MFISRDKSSFDAKKTAAPVEGLNNWLLGLSVNLICNSGLLLLHVWNHLLDVSINLILWMDIGDRHRVALTILTFQEAWASVNNESSIDHDSNVIT